MHSMAIARICRKQQRFRTRPMSGMMRSYEKPFPMARHQQANLDSHLGSRNTPNIGRWTTLFGTRELTLNFQGSSWLCFSTGFFANAYNVPFL